MKKVALVITIALLSGCATISQSELAEMSSSDLCPIWNDKSNNYNAWYADQEITKRRNNGEPINCMTASPDFNVCVTALAGGTPTGQAMAFEEAKNRGIKCDSPEYLDYVTAQQQLSIERQRNAIGLMAVGNNIANSSRPQSNPLVQCVQVANGVTNCQKVN